MQRLAKGRTEPIAAASANEVEILGVRSRDKNLGLDLIRWRDSEGSRPLGIQEQNGGSDGLVAGDEQESGGVREGVTGGFRAAETR